MDQDHIQWPTIPTKKKPSDDSEQMETEKEQATNTDKRTNPSPTIIKGTLIHEMPLPKTIQEIRVSQMPQTNETRNNSDIQSTTISTQPSREMCHPTMDLTID